MTPHDTPEAVERHAERVESCDLPETADMLRRLHKRAVDAERERDEHQSSFNIRWQADIRAIKRWQEKHPKKSTVWPDHADLVVWLLEGWEGCTVDLLACMCDRNTARADALREALKIARDAIPTASPPQTDHYGAHVAGERAAAERIVQRLAALIPAKKETPHGE